MVCEQPSVKHSAAGEGSAHAVDRKPEGGEVNVLDGWAAAQQQSQQTRKTGQQKPQEVQQNARYCTSNRTTP